MQSEFQKQMKQKKIDWPIIGITIVMCSSTFYLALKCVSPG